jgi:hypothetical protein
MESMESRLRSQKKSEPKSPPVSKPILFSNTTPPSDRSADRQFPVSFGLIISCRFGDVERLRESILNLGGRIVFQTVSEEKLFLFRESQVERALRGDVSALAEIHKKKERRVVK